ncbi:methylthioribulose-1-phosphate dehydratase [Actinocorallia herbida]|uniref:Methylthioribulose-1-phosphate dehydratase n=1 Tax=Actinocorallia herbida TaxID=58109 RepID=A0A3N1CWZ4_9ACTN|nr:acireductone synthase [Actinocorallia herbida]ROO85784.1 methylthioribulose-1-phosphate dehydratase [Actinocorallia herbida]
MSWIVLDIEGTTSATEAVHRDLYAYARPRLARYLTERSETPEVRAVRAAIEDDDPLAVLHDWMDRDVKATPLKTLQGLIWADGFAAGELTSHFFPDVPGALARWRREGARLAVFSSGSVASQRPWFGHSAFGDLGTGIDRYFDTVTAGPKREESSYRRIADALDDPSPLFLSDVPAELDAARAAGWRTAGVARPGEPQEHADFGAHPVLAEFAPGALPDRYAVGAALAVESARLAGLGWMRGTSGNLSRVLTRDPFRLAVTASGLDKADLTADDLAVVDATGRATGPGPRPSAEAGLHARIAEVTGADSVVHVHQLSAVRAARRHPDGVVLHDLEMLKGLGRAAHGDRVVVPVLANGQDMAEVGDRFAAAHDPAVPAVVLAAHGLYTWGPTPAAARHIAELLDWMFTYTLTD